MSAPTVIYEWDLTQETTLYFQGHSRVESSDTCFGNYLTPTVDCIYLVTSWLTAGQIYRLKFWGTGTSTRIAGVPCDTTTWHPYTVVFRAGSLIEVAVGDNDAVRVANIRLESASAAELAAFSDVAAYDLGVDVPDQTDASRLTLLPNTMNKLINGGELRMLLLGDSVCLDTSNGQWQALLERAFPSAQITPIVSIRSGTGVAWYAEENRLQEYVFQYAPDFVYIGGISHHGDPAPWASVIAQIKAALPNCEILIGSSASWYHADTATSEAIAAIAAANNVAFLDSAASYRYVQDELGLTLWDGETYVGVGFNQQVMYRDAQHQNQRGKEILARIIAAFFAGSANPSKYKASRWAGYNGVAPLVGV